MFERDDAPGDIDVEPHDLGVERERLPDKSTRFPRLPSGEVTHVVQYACRTFSQRVDAATQQGPVDLRAPRPERTPVRVAPHVAPGTVLTLRTFSTADGKDRMSLQLHCVDGTWQPAELPLYPGEYRTRGGAYEEGPPTGPRKQPPAEQRRTP